MFTLFYNSLSVISNYPVLGQSPREGMCHYHLGYTSIYVQCPEMLGFELLKLVCGLSDTGGKQLILATLGFSTRTRVGKYVNVLALRPLSECGGRRRNLIPRPRVLLQNHRAAVTGDVRNVRHTHGIAFLAHVSLK